MAVSRRAMPVLQACIVIGCGPPASSRGPLTWRPQFRLPAARPAGDAEDLEWEDVDAPPCTASQQEQQEHWRERAAARQRYWSLSHGFQMGRKLAAWGEAGQEEVAAGEAAAAAAAEAEAEAEAGPQDGGSARKREIMGEPRLPGGGGLAQLVLVVWPC